ncbi:MAG TPA: hypothetical protein ENK67_00160 [Flavobacteriia bacterium]|nr:hypothetical protein [Flavobacteriia bacterium]
MKRLVLVFVVLFGLSLNAQEHEVKLDVLDLAAFKSLDITYQYILNEESAVGLSVLKNLSDTDNIFNYREDFVITPFYRQYFDFAGMSNVYGEVFFALNSGRDFKDTDHDGVDDSIKYTDGAFGLVAGKSFVSPRGFVLDFYAGIGRNLFDAKGAPKIVPRIGINAGFRF